MSPRLADMDVTLDHEVTEALLPARAAAMIGIDKAL
jgi:hypothetical protein